MAPSKSVAPVYARDCAAKAPNIQKPAKYRHDVRYRSEIYAINALLRDHEREKFENFKIEVDAKRLIGEYISDDDGGGNSDESSVTSSPDRSAVKISASKAELEADNVVFRNLKTKARSLGSTTDTKATIRCAKTVLKTNTSLEKKKNSFGAV